MSQKPAARLGDLGDKHGSYPPTPIIAGDSSVLVNGRPVARQGDPLVPHAAPKKPPHPRAIAGGAGSVLIGGVPAARVGDPIDCGGTVKTGAGDVVIGDSPALPGDAGAPMI